MGFGPLAGLDQLGSFKFASAASTSSVITIPTCELLQVQFNITGYSSGGGIAALRFNGDTTTSAYNSSYISWTTAAPGAPTNSLATVGMFKLGQNSVTNQRSGIVTIYNFSGTAHLITCQSITQSAGSSAPVLSVGGGNWNSGGIVQIFSIQMVVDTGVNLTTGTSFAIFGANP